MNLVARSITRRLITFGAIVIVASACGGDDGEGSETTPVSSTVTLAPPTTTLVPATTVGAFECPLVLAVEFVEVGPAVFNVSATIRSVDVADVSYADAWEIRTRDGEVLGVRVLTHPHANEQPFTRSLSGVEIPVDITEVEVAAQDSVRGFCGEGLVVAVPHS